MLPVAVPAGLTELKLPDVLPRGIYYLQTRLDGQAQRFILRIE